jgi:hypothetical protein
MIESQRSLTEDVSGRCGQVSAGLAGGPMRGLVLYPLFGWRNLAMAGYIKFDGVDGEFQDKDHKNWSVIEAFSQVISKPGNGTGVTRRRGDVVLADIAVTKQLDKSSTKLAESVCKGKVFPESRDRCDSILHRCWPSHLLSLRAEECADHQLLYLRRHIVRTGSHCDGAVDAQL